MSDVNKINNPKKNSVQVIPDKLKIIQLNTSNADWDSKKRELISTIAENDADITIISESNAELDNIQRMTERKSMFSLQKLEI